MSGIGSPKSGNEVCKSCEKRVYPMDRLSINDVIFHKGCFKCDHCKGTISAGNYASLEGRYYCKTHFKELFKAKGNYSEGFGHEKHSSKWAPSTQTFSGVGN
eukprot:TRINITY_DN95_c0_g1_i1.p1 TRINITY_DN95_c0_g1~~TRINITY_DN95_c0_g1_i1.p1  ORF type:complete len:102 (+),score=28.12 TRINITY_DN95_c0_g1_i1:209-514(+)